MSTSNPSGDRTSTSGPRGGRASTARRVGIDLTTDGGLFRGVALVGTLALIASFVRVLYDVTAVVGSTDRLVLVVVLAILAATLLARVLSPRPAVTIALTLVIVGYAYYFTTTEGSLGVALDSIDQLVSDAIALLTGLSVLQIRAANVWALGFAPGPAFLAWYLAVRRRYVSSAMVGGAALVVLVLTGDATIETALAGTVGAIAAIGFGELERRDGTLVQVDVLTILFAVVVIVATSLSVVPSGAAAPVFLLDDGRDATLESTLTDSPRTTAIRGQMELSPEVRFTIRATDSSYWRVGVYDRFTGDSWVRPGRAAAYEGRLAGPPGDSQRVLQTVSVETDGINVMPAAPEPVQVLGDAARHTSVSAHGQLQPDQPFIEGDVYTVESSRVDASPDELRAAGTDYPDEIEETYLQPEVISDQLRFATGTITADAETPYDEAVAIEQYLRTTKGYSLDVERPDGNVADAFLFEMSEGYCVYFATTMVQMLRSQDVPARYVVGYTPGQQVGENEWVVRGLNSHAWVEAYFPEHGWVAFDPTPGGSREDVRAERLDEARSAGEEGVDTDRSADTSFRSTVDGTTVSHSPLTPEQTSNQIDNSSESESARPGLVNQSGNLSGGGPLDDLDRGDLAFEDRRGVTPGGAVDDERSVPLSAEELLVGLVLIAGVTASARHSGATSWIRRSLRLQWNGRRRTPERDVERAFGRLELLLERRYRPRHPAESPRQYVRSVARGRRDDRVQTVAATYERAHYGDGVTRAEADEAIETTDAMVREATPVLRWFAG